MIIQDGTGRGYSAKCDKNHHLHVQGFNTDNRNVVGLDGGSYSLNTGIISLTVGTSGVFYFKNNEEFSVFIDLIEVYIGTMGVAGDVTIKMYKNTTAGTLIDGASAVAINQNINFGSSNTLADSLAYKGADGNTVTDGDLCYQMLKTGGSTSTDTKIILQPGNSVAVEITVPGNTTTLVEALLHKVDEATFE
jgi:hypothetical protein